MKLKCTLIGSRHFGASVLANLLEDGHEVVRVVAAAADDRLAIAAREAGLPLSILESPRKVPGSDLHEDCDIIIAAHTHAFVTPEALARARLGAFGYHPSLLPRHRGIAAVEWTLLEGDPIAGGSIYHLDAGWDDGAIAAQDTRVASIAWFGALNEVVARWLLAEHPGRLEDAYPALRAILLRSVGVDEARIGPVPMPTDKVEFPEKAR